MSSVNRAGSVSVISPRHSFLRKNFDVLYEKPACDRDLGNRNNLRICELALLVKLQESKKLRQSRTIQV